MLEHEQDRHTDTQRQTSKCITTVTLLSGNKNVQSKKIKCMLS